MNLLFSKLIFFLKNKKFLKGIIFALAGFIIGLNFILNWVIKKNRRSIIVLMLCFVILLSGILVLISGIIKITSNVDSAF